MNILSRARRHTLVATVAVTGSAILALDPKPVAAACPTLPVYQPMRAHRKEDR